MDGGQYIVQETEIKTIPVEKIFIKQHAFIKHVTIIGKDKNFKEINS